MPDDIVPNPDDPERTFIKNGGEEGIRTLGSDESLVFKTSSINRSDTSPCQVTDNMIASFLGVVNTCRFVFSLTRSFSVCRYQASAPPVPQRPGA